MEQEIVSAYDHVFIQNWFPFVVIMGDCLLEWNEIKFCYLISDSSFSETQIFKTGKTHWKCSIHINNYRL